jgi:hypothetical protein
MYTVILSAMILCPAMLFALVADLPHVFFITLTGVAISLFSRRPVRYSDRSIIYSLVASITIAALFNLAFPMRDNRLGYISIFFYPNILVPFLLYLSICITLFKPHPRGFGIILACMLVCMMFGGDVLNADVVGERLPSFMPLMLHFLRTYTVMVFIEFAFVLAGVFYWTSLSRRKVKREGRLQVRLLRFIVLITIPVMASGAMYLYAKNERLVRNFENYLLRLGVKRFHQHMSRISFNKKVDLNITISPELRKDFDIILFRVRSAAPPGYMRGKAYVSYSAGQWQEQDRAGAVFNVKEHGGMIAYNSYSLGSGVSDADMLKLDVFPDGRFSTDTLLLPGNFRQIDIIANRIQCDYDGSVTVSEWNREGAYACFVHKINQNAAWPLPEKEAEVRDDVYLQVPPEIEAGLDNFYEKVFASYAGRELKDSEIINTLSLYFNSRFQYSLGVTNESGGDPVLNFLHHAGKGHCELFASAMTLLLRRQGIPARYVTGFMCEEKHPAGYYVSRIGNAHAWLEAFPRDKQQWILVEPTPPDGISTGAERQWGGFESLQDRLSLILRETLALLRRGVIARAIINLSSGLFEITVEFISQPFGATVIGILLIGILVFMIRRMRKRRKMIDADTLLPGNVKVLRKGFLKMEKSIAKKYNTVRSPGETVDEWLARIEQDYVLPPNIRTTINQYRKVRFSGTRRQPDDSVTGKP